MILLVRMGRSVIRLLSDREVRRHETRSLFRDLVSRQSRHFSLMSILLPVSGQRDRLLKLLWPLELGFVAWNESSRPQEMCTLENKLRSCNLSHKHSDGAVIFREVRDKRTGLPILFSWETGRFSNRVRTGILNLSPERRYQCQRKTPHPACSLH